MRIEPAASRGRRSGGPARAVPALPAVSAVPTTAARTVSFRAIQNGTLWLLVASGSLVLIEPSPYEAFFAVALLVFGLALRVDGRLTPLVVCLVLFNLGGLLALIPWTDDRESVTYVFTSTYVSATAIFFACVMLERPLERLDIIRRAFTVAAVIASIAGIIGYFDIAGLHDAFTKYDRATGTFKDPNVLGPFLVPPLVWMAQRIALGIVPRTGLGRLAGAAALVLVLTGFFLTFSRGAWGVGAASIAVMLGLTFVTADSSRLRLRIVAFVIVGTLATVALLAVALSFSSIRDVFIERASLSQDYDLGETGRFGNQLRSLPLLLTSPNGFGPLQFRHLFAEEDPHNVYVNAFASYGWLGGFAYCTLIVMTLYAGFWLVFRRTALQHHAIVIWSCLFVQIAQGLQIDTDHWRHLYLLLGCTWGLAAVTQRSVAEATPYLRTRT